MNETQESGSQSPSTSEEAESLPQDIRTKKREAKLIKKQLCDGCGLSYSKVAEVQTLTKQVTLCTSCDRAFVKA